MLLTVLKQGDIIINVNKEKGQKRTDPKLPSQKGGRYYEYSKIYSKITRSNTECANSSDRKSKCTSRTITFIISIIRARK